MREKSRRPTCNHSYVFTSNPKSTLLCQIRMRNTALANFAATATRPTVATKMPPVAQEQTTPKEGVLEAQAAVKSESESDSDSSSESESDTDDTDTEVEELLGDSKEDDLPHVTQHTFPTFWEIAAKEYDLIKFPVDHPRSKFHYTVIPGSRCTEDALSAYKAVPYFNTNKHEFRKAFVAYEEALTARKQRRRGRKAARGRMKKRKKLMTRSRKLAATRRVKAKRVKEATAQDSPSVRYSDSDSDSNQLNTDYVDSFVRRIRKEKQRHLDCVIRSLAKIDARIEAITQEQQELSARRVTLQEQQDKLESFEV